jgi:hypothetical protein
VGVLGAAGRAPSPNMQNTFRGHLAVLVDEYTYSDGETFAAGIKSLGLGPLVGKRTAGAGVWLSDNNRLSDNGMARVAEMGQFNSEDGQWLIEGVGVRRTWWWTIRRTPPTKARTASWKWRCSCCPKNDGAAGQALSASGDPGLNQQAVRK